MSSAVVNKGKIVTSLLNATLKSMKSVIPIEFQTLKPRLMKQDLLLSYGVLIGMTGQIQGKLVLVGDPNVFGSIGETMYGMPLEGEMLLSFSGELGNMIAGGISTNIAEEGIGINITSPTLMQGDTKLSGYKQALELTVNFVQKGKLTACLLLD